MYSSMKFEMDDKEEDEFEIDLGDHVKNFMEVREKGDSENWKEYSQFLKREFRIRVQKTMLFMNEYVQNHQRENSAQKSTIEVLKKSNVKLEKSIDEHNQRLKLLEKDSEDSRYLFMRINRRMENSSFEFSSTQISTTSPKSQPSPDKKKGEGKHEASQDDGRKSERKETSQKRSQKHSNSSSSPKTPTHQPSTKSGSGRNRKSSSSGHNQSAKTTTSKKTKKKISRKYSSSRTLSPRSYDSNSGRISPLSERYKKREVRLPSSFEHRPTPPVKRRKKIVKKKE